uniref:Uncharacterized protein n=1 Tax=Panagrolaimus sp. ES5 TaxID=591445 RepID=A0AC34FS99_9BILA
MNLKTSHGLFDPNESNNLRDFHNSLMKLYRKWAELKTKLDSTAREPAEEKKWKEFSSDVIKIKLQMTSWEEKGEDNSGGLPIIDPSIHPYAYINVFENLQI